MWSRKENTGCQIIPYGFVNFGEFPKDKEQDSGAHAVLSAERGLFRMVTVLQTFDGGREVNSNSKQRGRCCKEEERCMLGL